MLLINTEVSFLFIFLCFFLGFFYSVFLYYNETRVNKKIIWFLFLFRRLLVAFIAFLLLNPFVKSIKNIYEKPIVVIAQDVSSSIEDYAIHDKLLHLESTLKEDNFDVYSYNFSHKVEEGIIGDYLGDVTDYSNFIDFVNNKFMNRNVTGIVFASDGLYNTGSNPLYKNNSFPFYVLALGDTVTRRDITISKILNNDFVIKGNSFPVEVSLHAYKCINERINVQIFKNNQLEAEKEIYINKDDELSKVIFQIQSDDIGVQKYNVRVSDLKDEISDKNNKMDFYIEVIDEVNNVLFLLGNAHPDISAFKHSIQKNINYNIDVVYIEDFKNNFESYQLVVLSGLSSMDIQQFESYNIPTLIFSRGDIMNYKSLLPSISLSQESYQEEGYITNNPIFSRFSFSDDVKQIFNTAPPLNIYINQLNILNNENVISFYSKESQINYPVIFLDELESKKSIAILVEGFWRTKLYDYKVNQNTNAFDEFCNKITKLLVFHQNKNRFIVESPKKLLEYNDVIFEAEIYNEIYNLISNENIDLEIQTEDGELLSFVFLKDEGRYSLNLGVLELGNYSWKAKTRDSEFEKSGTFLITKSELEYTNMEADHTVLYQLSRMLAGGLFFPNQESALIQQLKSNSNTILHTREKKHGIIDIPWILLILLSFATFEWVVRRYNGLI